MSYWVQCAACKDARKVSNIVDLIQQNTDPRGNLVCPKCATAYFSAKSALQETGNCLERCIKAVIPVETDFETNTPYVFLTAPSPTGAPRGVHFNYHKDTRASGGRLKSFYSTIGLARIAQITPSIPDPAPSPVRGAVAEPLKGCWRRSQPAGEDPKTFAATRQRRGDGRTGLWR